MYAIRSYYERTFGLFYRGTSSEKAIAAKTEEMLQSIQRMPSVRENGLVVSAAIAAVTGSEPSFHHLLIRVDRNNFV